MDNERDALERQTRAEVRDADDKQWYIECETLEIEKLKAQAAIEEAEARKLEAKAVLAEAEAVKAKVNADNKTEHHLKVDCSNCGSTFEYKGSDAEQMTECYDKFQYQHSSCT